MPDFLELTNYHSYFFNPFSIPPLIVAIAGFVFGISIFNSGRDQDLNRGLLYVFLSVALWMAASSLMLSSLGVEIGLFWARLFFIGIISLALTTYHFTVIYTQKYNQQVNILWMMYVLGVLLSLFAWHPSFWEGMGWHFFGIYPRAGFFTPIIFLFLTACAIVSGINLVHYHLMEIDAKLRNETRFLILLVLIVQASFVDLIATYSPIYPFGYLILLILVLSLVVFKLRNYAVAMAKATTRLQTEIDHKSREVSQALAELRATQLKLLESGKVSAVASLSAGILHQISQPLTAIHGFTRFIKKEMNAKDTFYRPICLIEEQSVYLKKMLEDLMDLVRHREIKKELININDPIKKATDLLSDELRIRRINWDCDLADVLPMLLADGIHLQQIFMNIIINSIQALSQLPRGDYRHLRVVSEYRESEQAIIVSFRDNGPGVHPSDEEKIFEPFFSTKTDGSGMGLALCHDLIAEHGGSIALENEGNGGAKFVVRFPVAYNQIGK